MTPPRVQREIHGQLDASSTTGDCFRACMPVLLDVPNGDHLPHGINLPGWWLGWWSFLWQRISYILLTRTLRSGTM